MRILKESYEKALELLRENRSVMDKLAEHLLEKETITGKEFMRIYREEKGIPEPEEKKDEKKEAQAEDKSGEQVEGNAEVKAEPQETPYFSQALEEALKEPKKEAESEMAEEAKKSENDALEAVEDKPQAEAPKQVQQGIFSNAVLPDSDKDK